MDFWWLQTWRSVQVENLLRSVKHRLYLQQEQHLQAFSSPHWAARCAESWLVGDPEAGPCQTARQARLCRATLYSNFQKTLEVFSSCEKSALFRDTTSRMWQLINQSPSRTMISTSILRISLEMYSQIYAKRRITDSWVPKSAKK